MRLGAAAALVAVLLFPPLLGCASPARRVILGFYATAVTLASRGGFFVRARLSDPVPEFDLSVNRSSKSITVTVEPGEKVYARWCFETNGYCSSGSHITIDSARSRSAVLNVPYRLPCVCVQVYFTHRDALRRKRCPFQNEGLTDVGDVWRSTEVILSESSLKLSSVCPTSHWNISSSLCWKRHEHLCIPVLNSTLEEMEEEPHLKYNTSAVDKHPEMCVQFSLQGSRNISCPFQADVPSWQVHIGLGRQGVFVCITSRSQAKYSAQLCVLTQMGCSPVGTVHTIIAEGKAAETRIHMPPDFIVQKPCVQVWQADPALHGRRILCPDYTHHRRGLYALAALVLLVIIAALGVFLRHLTRPGAPSWLCIPKPVLLVCSSEQSDHVSAVGALASILQGELKATVHMALWAQTSQRGIGAGSGVTDLGLLPWLYGQWEAVHKAQGRVLIIWSPEAKATYDNWSEGPNVEVTESPREDGGKADGRDGNKSVDLEEGGKVSGRRLIKCKKEQSSGREKSLKLCDEKDWSQQKEASSVIAPIFAGALAYLQGSLQQAKGQGAAIVYFQGLGHSRDIPKTLKAVPRYCLPQDFSGLIRELGGMRRGAQSEVPCLPRLLATVQTLCLARQLTGRLRTLLPPTRGEKGRGPRATEKRMQRRLGGPPAAAVARPETVQEQEPLHGSPWRLERL